MGLFRAPAEGQNHGFSLCFSMFLRKRLFQHKIAFEALLGAILGPPGRSLGVVLGAPESPREAQMSQLGPYLNQVGPMWASRGLSGAPKTTPKDLPGIPKTLPRGPQRHLTWPSKAIITEALRHSVSGMSPPRCSSKGLSSHHRRQFSSN